MTILNRILIDYKKIKETIKNKESNEIIIDEWDINSEQSQFRKELSDSAVEKNRFVF